MRSATALAVAAALACASPAAAAAPAVAPLHSAGSIVRYPRLTAFPDAAAMARANAVLAARERDWNSGRADCMADLADQAPGRKPDTHTYFETVDVRYLSARYLSLDIREFHECDGWHPDDNESTPLTLDLATGKPVDWDKVFAKDFSLAKLYRERYAKQGGAADPDCKRVIAEELGDMNIWLDAKQGLMVRPQLFYVVSACADVIAFAPAELDRYIAQDDFRRDFDATVRR